MRHLLTIVCALLMGCNVAAIPAETVMVSDVPEILDIAERTADFVGASEECRNWDEVGIYWAVNESQFEDLSHGWKYEDAYGIAFQSTEDDSVDTMIFLSSRGNSIVIAHEIFHHIKGCETGHGDGDHEDPMWEALEGHFYDLTCEYEINPYAAGPTYEIQHSNPDYIRCEPGGSF